MGNTSGIPETPWNCENIDWPAVTLLGFIILIVVLLASALIFWVVVWILDLLLDRKMDRLIFRSQRQASHISDPYAEVYMVNYGYVEPPQPPPTYQECSSVCLIEMPPPAYEEAIHIEVFPDRSKG